MELDLNTKDINEIEKNYDALTGWLVSHFTSFSAAAFVLNSVILAVDNAKKEMEKENA